MTDTFALAERDDTANTHWVDQWWVTQYYRTDDSPYGQAVRAGLRNSNPDLYLTMSRFTESWTHPEGQAFRDSLREENLGLYLTLMREERRRRILSDPGWHPRTAQLLIDETPWSAEQMAAAFGVERGAVWAWMKPRRPVSGLHPSLLEPDLEQELRNGRLEKVCTAGWARENFLTSLKGKVDPHTGEIYRADRQVGGRAKRSTR